MSSTGFLISIPFKFPHLSWWKLHLSNRFVVVQSLGHVPSLFPNGFQYARLSCSSPSAGVCSHSCSLSRWCHPTISSSVTPFSSCPQSFPVSESLPVSWLFVSDDQSIGASASASVLPVNTQGWYPLGLTFNKASIVIVLQNMMVHITPDHKPPVVLHLSQSQCPRVWVAHMMLSPAYGGSIESKL